MSILRGMRLRLVLDAILFSLVVNTTTQGASAQTVTLTPSPVIAGSPVLIRIDAPQSTDVEGEWRGEKLQFFRSASVADPAQQAWYALAGTDVEASPGSTQMTLHLTGPAASSGTATGTRPLTQTFTQTVVIEPTHYHSATLTVAPGFVEPSPTAQQQIAVERTLKDRIFSISRSRALWSGRFLAPVNAQPTDSFGTRRTFNGKLASIHKGMDFRARSGTPVRAANAGLVVLAQPLYFEGNCIVIDHGLGLYTLSMHLSRIDVKEGEPVEKGELIGLSGATGRATGPHLHWAVRWHSAYLDPQKLLKLNLPETPGSTARSD